MNITIIEPAHALLSASGAHKWTVCTRSARLEAEFPDQDSEFSSEGTFGHEVFHFRMSEFLGQPTRCDTEAQIAGYGKYFTSELSESVQEAVEYAQNRVRFAFSHCVDTVVLLEQRLNFSRWVPEGFGTADMVIITDKYIEVIDLKLGRGVRVDAFQNAQFRLYMLGAMEAYGHLYGAEVMRGVVLQPRLGNYSEEETSTTDLLLWADQVVVPAAKLAWAGEGEFVAGEHCTSGFCKARAVCAARAQANLAVARADFAGVSPDLLSDDQITKVLEHADEAIKWLSDVQAHALEQASKYGKQFPGFKVVEGRSVRKYSDPDAVASALTAAGIPEAVIFERSLLGITAMTEALGKKKFTELVGPLVVKPAGKPILVPVTDKREAIQASVESDFSATL